MQFLVLAYDGTDDKAGQRRQTARPAHLALGEQMIKSRNLLYAAAMLNEKGKMCGSMLVTSFESREAVDAWLSQEPYVISKVWEKIEVIPCKIGPSFENLRPELSG